MAAKETTTSYRWGDGIIRRIDVRAQSDGRAVAYLYADEREVARAQRQEIRAAIRLKGWGTLSDHREGKFALRVSGLKDGNELLTMLTSAGFVGAPIETTTTRNDDAPKTIGQHIKRNSLRLSAVVYALGDLLYFKGANKLSDKGMALSFGFGDIMLGIFGGRDDSRQFKSLLSQMKNHMDANGIEIPKNASIHMEVSQQDRGFDTRVTDFLHQHINSIKILSEIVGGAFVLRSGLTPDKDGPLMGKRNRFNIVSGVLIMAGWAGALLVKEKKPEKEPENLADSTINHFHEKPLRLAGYAGLGFNALKITEAFVNNRPTSNWNKSAVTSMVAANALYSVSNKTGGDISAQEMVSDVYSVAAQILNKQPENVREAAVASTAKFLGERTEIKDTHSQIVARLHEEMTIQRQNPWFETRGLPAYTPVSKPARGIKVPRLEEAPRTTVQAAGMEHARADDTAKERA